MSAAIAADMDVYGESLYSIAFLVSDLDETERYLKGKGVEFVDRDATTLVADRSTTHGAQFSFTTCEIPNDPRQPWA
ncbi:MAG: hypothetical protein ACHQDE_05510, partial [Acidimicrobiia bacterium]